MSTWIKICGIVRLEDALQAVRLGANALGFNFYRSSRRFIEPEAALNIIKKLPPDTVKVGVFVNEVDVQVSRIKSFCGLDLLQFHGDEPHNYCQNFNTPFLKAFRLADEGDLALLRKFLDEGTLAGNHHLPRILLDTRLEGTYGGTGEIFDWNLALKAKDILRQYQLANAELVMAGGLMAENVCDALTAVRPFGVDVSSGIERHPQQAPGKKDEQRLRLFIENVRRWDREQSTKETKQTSE